MLRILNGRVVGAEGGVGGYRRRMPGEGKICNGNDVFKKAKLSEK